MAASSSSPNASSWSVRRGNGMGSDATGNGADATRALGDDASSLALAVDVALAVGAALAVDVAPLEFAVGAALEIRRDASTFAMVPDVAVAAARAEGAKAAPVATPAETLGAAKSVVVTALEGCVTSLRRAAAKTPARLSGASLSTVRQRSMASSRCSVRSAATP